VAAGVGSGGDEDHGAYLHDHAADLWGREYRGVGGRAIIAITGRNDDASPLTAPVARALEVRRPGEAVPSGEADAGVGKRHAVLWQ
jgi:hypothetical protein